MIDSEHEKAYMNKVEQGNEIHSQRYARRFELNMRCTHAIELLDEALCLNTDELLMLYKGLTKANLSWLDGEVKNILEHRAHPNEREIKDAKTVLPHSSES